MIDLGTLDRYLYGLMRLPEFKPSDGVLKEALGTSDELTERERQLYQFGQVMASYGARQLLLMILKQEEEEDDPSA